MGQEISIQQLLEILEDEVLEGKSKEELCSILRRFARLQPVDKRQSFISQLKEACADEVVHEKTEESLESIATYLESISALKRELEERSELIEEGRWDELDDYYYEERGYYDDYGPDYVSEQACQEADEIFTLARHKVLDGDYEFALPLCSALIKLESEINGVGNLCCRELGEIYCLSVFMCADESNREQAFFDAVSFVVSHLRFSSEIVDEQGQISLQNLLTILGKPFYLFLQKWKSYLNQQEDYRIANRLYAEILVIDQEWGELELLMDKPVEEYGSAWIFSLYSMEKAEQWERLAGCCKVVLPSLNDHIYIYVATLLSKAGKKLNDTELINEGIVLRFIYSPSKELLGELCYFCKNLIQIRKELKKCMRAFSEKQFSRENAVVLLLQGKLEEAYRRCGTMEALGWNSGPYGDVVCAGLVAICGNKIELPSEVLGVLKYYYKGGCSWSNDIGVESNNYLDKLEEIIKLSMGALNLTDSEKKEWLEMFREVTERRIEAVLDGKYRGAYNRVAQLMVAWAQTADRIGMRNEGQGFINETMCRYRRFSAFRKEVNIIINQPLFCL